MKNRYEWEKTRTIYWSDELNDDFNDLGIDRPRLAANYKYVHKNIFVRLWDGLLYYGIAKPILATYCFFHGIRFKNRKVLKKLNHVGAFIYSNHVAISDAFKFAAYIIPFKKVNVVGYSDASSIPVAKHLVKSLGYLPIPQGRENFNNFTKAIEYLVKIRKQYILIYPEAHIWPYYTKIRHFKTVSFHYPANMDIPVVPAVTVFRKSKFSDKPKQTVIFGEPIYPDPTLTVLQNKQMLAAKCFEEMEEISNSVKQYEYIKYIKKDE